jgi:hypothetical protein
MNHGGIKRCLLAAILKMPLSPLHFHYRHTMYRGSIRLIGNKFIEILAAQNFKMGLGIRNI